jgi:hypothetical protein
VIEFGVALCNPPYDSNLERWGPVLCDFLVAIGVAGEVLFAARSKRCQDEQLKRSDAKLGHAFDLASGAEVRAADAQKEAAELRLRAAEIERLTAWRHVTPEVNEAIRRGLLGLASHVQLVVEFQRSDPEAYMYSRELIQSFGNAGVFPPIVWKANEFMAGFVFGINMWSDPNMHFEPLARELLDAGVRLSLMARPATGYEQTHNLYLFVGAKAPWIPGLVAIPSPAQDT